MYHFDADKALSFKSIHLFYLCIILFLGIGLVTLYSASFSFALRFYGDGNYFFGRQVRIACIAAALFIICAVINLNIVRKLTGYLTVIAIGMCVLSLLPNTGVERYGASRWIQIGKWSYQPSEIVKIVLPILLAHLLDKNAGKNENFFSGYLLPLFVTGIFFVLINLQNNFSTAVFIVCIVLIMFYLAGMRYLYFIAVSLFILPISALLVFTRDHRVLRLVSFLKPAWNPLGAGFQVNASVDAIISGSFLGKGIGEGTRKIASIPEIHSDFIFSAYAEETGFLGVILFFVLISVFALFGFRTALKCGNYFGRFLCSGLTAMLVLQMLLNMAVISGVLPATGIPLPFFSAGGSSLLTSLVSCGLIANIAINGHKLENNINEENV